MRISLATLSLSLLLLAPATSQEMGQSLEGQLKDAVSTTVAQNEVREGESFIVQLKERLRDGQGEARNGRVSRARVGQAPKSWPYPMVVNPRQPVLPGAAW